jgi:death-on-curing protein
MIVGDPVFLSLGDVIEIHRDQIARYGGDPGIRDLGLLQSAVAIPAAGFGGRFLHTDLFEMAAAYLFHISQNHPFIDGN